MATERLPAPIRDTASLVAPFDAVIRADLEGWVTIIDLGKGATLSKWFPDEEHARRYPVELMSWLSRRRE